jgi:hypothetical protein
MSFKDGEWWACCAFIIIISYTLGTLTGIPTWSVGDTKLSVMTDLATIIGGTSTVAMALIALITALSWRSNTKYQRKIQALDKLATQFSLFVNSVGLLKLELQHNKCWKQTVYNYDEDHLSELRNEESRNKIRTLFLTMRSQEDNFRILYDEFLIICEMNKKLVFSPYYFQKLETKFAKQSRSWEDAYTGYRDEAHKEINNYYIDLLKTNKL